MNDQPKHLHLPRLPDDEWHDSVTITTKERFKTSGLSGDEWRFSAVTRIFRKGVELHEHVYHTVEDAAAHLPWLLKTYAEDGVEPYLTEFQCMQPGCPELATALFYQVKRGCGHCGSTNDTREHLGPMEPYRAFCDKHKKRGNSNLDDMDSCYEPADIKMLTDRRSPVRPSDAKLAEALRAGLPDVAAEAERGDYNDFFSDRHDMPKIELVNRLERLKTNAMRYQLGQLKTLVARVKNGDFDSDKAESGEWFANKEESANGKDSSMDDKAR